MSRTFELRIQIQATPDRVFATMSDLQGALRWMKGAVRMETLTPGEFGKGTEWRETRKMFGHEASEVFEVTEFVPNRRMSLFCDGSCGSSKKGEFRFTYELEPEGGTTRVLFRGEISMPGFMARIFGGLMNGMFRKMCLRDLESMKQHIELSA